MFFNGVVGIVGISDCEWNGEGVSLCRRPKAEFLGVSPISLPPMSPSASVVNLSFLVFRVSQRQTGRVGRGGPQWAISKYTNIMQFPAGLGHTPRLAVGASQKCKFPPQYWSIMGACLPGESGHAGMRQQPEEDINKQQEGEALKGFGVFVI